MGEDFQLTVPPLSTGWRATPPSLGDFHLHLDPDIEAKLKVLDSAITVGWIKGLWKSPNWDAFDMTALLYNAPTDPLLVKIPPDPTAKPPKLPGPLYAPGTGPDSPREPGKAGKPGDVLKAVWSYSAVQDAANRVFDATLKRDWNRAGVGERVLMITGPAVIAAGAVAGIIGNDSARKAVLESIAGTDIKVPGIDGLSFRLKPTGGGITTPVPFVKGLGIGGNFEPHKSYDLTVTFDLMPWIRGD